MRTRDRDQIDQSYVDDLIDKIKIIIAAYESKKTRRYFFSGSPSQAILTTLKSLSDGIKSINDNSKNTPFVKYMGILHAISRANSDLPAEVAGESGALISLLKDELRQQKEADWAQVRRKDSNRAENESQLISYALSALSDAADYTSQAHQEFCEKWQLYGRQKPEDLQSWKWLTDKFSESMNESHYPRLIMELGSLIGIPARMSMSSTVSDARVDDSGREDSLISTIISRARGIVDNSNKTNKNAKLIDTLKSLLRDIRIYPGNLQYQDALIKWVKLIEKKAEWTGLGLVGWTELSKKINEVENEIKVFDLGNLVTLCTEYMRQYIDMRGELQTLPEVKLKDMIYHFIIPLIQDVINPARELLSMKPYPTRLEESVDEPAMSEESVAKPRKIEPKKTELGIEMARLSDNVKELITTDRRKKLPVWKHLRNNFVERMNAREPAGLMLELKSLIAIPSDGSVVPTTAIQQGMEDAQLYDSYLAAIAAGAHELLIKSKPSESTTESTAREVNEILEPLRYLLKNIDDDPRNKKHHAALIQWIIEQKHNKSWVNLDMLSWMTLSEKMEKLEDIVKGFDLKGLLTRCTDYMNNYIAKRGESQASPKVMLDEVVHKFIIPFIKDVINPGRELLGLSQYPTRENEIVELNNLRNIVRAMTSNAENKKLTDTIRGILRDIPGRANADEKAIHKKINNIEDNNPWLYKAIKAACTYYNAELGRKHGTHGKNAAKLFIRSLWDLPDNCSLVDIQKEALKYIKGEGNYGRTLFGGASGYDGGSRIAYLLDVGLFDDQLSNEESLPINNLSSPGSCFSFFKHQLSFSRLEASDRKLLTDVVKNLKI